MRFRVPMGALAVLLPILVAGGCGGPETPSSTLEFRGPTMGTTWNVKIAPGDRRVEGDDSIRIDRRIRDDLARINLLMSTWDPESELSRFNRHTGPEAFPVSPETFDVFQWSIEMAALTEGALDVTVAPLVEAWGFGAAPEEGTTAPDPETLERLRQATGVHLLELDPERRAIRKLRPEVRVDFSSIAPGYAADRLGAILADEFGFTDFLVDVGGELVARGRNEQGQPWQVAVERPDVRGRSVARIVPVTNAAIATSGDYRNYREVDGERVSHILDPRTGRPVTHRLASVTIVDDLAVRADALATALMVLGPEEGMALAERIDLAALLLVRNERGGFEEQMSARFEELVNTP
jgi:FAD:protein FMN transferase